MNAVEVPLEAPRGDARPVMVMTLADRNPARWGGGEPLPDRLRRWAGDAYWQLLEHHKGHVVEQVGNGLVMEFADARQCVQAAFALNRLADAMNARASAAERLRLRAAAHLATYAQGQRKPADRDLRLASDLTGLAEPGEVLVTAELRDQLADGFDADFEDLGHWVESFAQPVRLFRADPRHAGTANRLMPRDPELRPGLAVMPFKPGTPDARNKVIGELIADGVIARLSHSNGLRVISRQSTSALRNSEGLGDLQRHLGATFVLSGSYIVRNRKLIVVAELAEACSHALLWSGQLRQPLDDLLLEDSEMLHTLAGKVVAALGTAQVNKALTRPLPTLDSSSLMLAGISMVHSHSRKVFERGHEALTLLASRHPDLALPRAWLGMWHALNVVKGSSGNVARDIKLAREQTRRALQDEPHNAMALAVEGYIHCQLLGEQEPACEHLTAAIEANPSEPMAWLFKSLHSAMWGSSAFAVTEAHFANALSPVDPLQYFFDLLTGNAMLADHRLELALAYGRKSLKANKHHVPTLRLLLTAEAELGRLEEGRKTLSELRAEAPDLTVASYLAMGSADSPMRQRVAEAMRRLGMPEG